MSSPASITKRHSGLTADLRTRFNPEMMAALKKRAEREGMTVAWVNREAVAFFLASPASPKKAR